MGEVSEKEVKAFSKKLGEPEFILKKRLRAASKLKGENAVFRYGLNIMTRFDAETGSFSGMKQARYRIKNSGKATAINLKEAYGKKELRQFMKNADISHALVAVNTAFLNSGAFIRLPANEECGTVHLKLEGSGRDYSHIMVVAEEGSMATIIEDSGGSPKYRSSVVEITAGKNAAVRYGAVQRTGKGRVFAYRKAVAERDALVEWLDIATGGEASKTEVYTELRGDGAKSSIYTVFFGNERQQFDFIGKCTHIGRNTESLMMTSGVLKDSAKAIQQGFAKITEKAYGAAAHQKAKILLLSENAKASPIPKLEIDNNDVAATHEASVGQIEREKMFYLMSRGLSEKEAKKAYVGGFLEQYTSKIKIDELKKSVETIVSKRMEDD